MSETLELAMDLLGRESVTPNDAGCQAVMTGRLQALGFEIQRMRFGEVENFWARRGTSGPLFAFAGHTDVVPTGPLAHWDSHPFRPEIRGSLLFGRGAADMKGSLAAMVTACERFVTAFPQHRGSLAFLITSDEEGPAVNGTIKVVEALESRNEKIDYCLVGEPSSAQRIGDVVKNGRRGSLNGKLTVVGKQGHVAYPQLALNPAHQFAAALDALVRESWDQGNAFFPPTSFQVSNLHMGEGADNVIPAELQALFNFRFSTEVTPVQLQQRVSAILDAHGVDYRLAWRLSGHPFLTPEGQLVDAVQQAVIETTGYQPTLSTGGGTSDGRFIAPTGSEVVELGPVNATIHQINECVAVEDLDLLSRIYERILERLVR